MANQHWLARSFQAVWHPCSQMKSHEHLPIIPIRQGTGIWLTDFEGKHYLDAVSSWWVNLFGHGEPRIKAAISAQLEQLEHIMLAGFTHEPVVELSERLGQLTGLGHAFYGSDGASATEIALKMSFHFWRNTGKPNKKRFIHLENSYHGETVGALAVTDIPLFSNTYAPLVKQGLRTPTPDSRLSPQDSSPLLAAQQAAKALEAILAQHAEEVAAIIVEPLVQAAAGMAMYHPAYLSEARRLASDYNVHLIADEIAVGFGRTGTLFACEQAAIQPDILCLSKGITGGFLPLSCVLVKNEIYAAFYDDDMARGFLHSHSYTGNPLACRAALAVLDIFRDDRVLEQNNQKILSFAPLFTPLREHPRVQNFRQCGMIWAFDVITQRPDFTTAFFKSMLAQQCLVRPINNTVYFMPPYCVEEEHIIQLVAATQRSLARTES